MQRNSRYKSLVISGGVETSLTISAMKAFLLSCVVLLGITLCVFAADKPEEKLKPALDVITPDALLAHIKILSSDEFEGRSPGTKGEELSIKYISDQFKSVGLKPGNPDGSYFQEVPLAGIKNTRSRRKKAQLRRSPFTKRNRPLIRGKSSSRAGPRRISSSIIRIKTLTRSRRAPGSRLMLPKNYSPIAARISTRSKNPRSRKIFDRWR